MSTTDPELSRPVFVKVSIKIRNVRLFSKLKMFWRKDSIDGFVENWLNIISISISKICEKNYYLCSNNYLIIFICENTFWKFRFKSIAMLFTKYLVCKSRNPYCHCGHYWTIWNERTHYIPLFETTTFHTNTTTNQLVFCSEKYFRLAQRRACEALFVLKK